MSLLDLITGGESSVAQQDLANALSNIKGVQAPTADELKFQLQKLVQAGVITPQQAATYTQGPNALAGENVPQQGTQAQETSIADLLSAANAGGLNPEEEAQQQKIIQEMNTAEKGANDAALQGAAARGSLTGGETLAAELGNNQNEAQNANAEAEANAGNAYQQMLNELTSAGAAGGALQGQENTQANTVAAATNAINQFNTAQQQEEANFNTTNANEAQAANVENLQNIENQNVENENTHALQQSQLPEEVFNSNLDKAKAEAGVGEAQANQATAQGGQEAALIGGAIGAGGQVYGNIAGQEALGKALNPQPAWEGGEIHKYLSGGDVTADNPREKARIPGNAPQNDRIPALLSEGEVVLPRTVAQHPQPDRVMAFLNRLRQKKEPAPVHPHDIKSVLDGLTLRRAQP